MASVRGDSCLPSDDEPGGLTPDEGILGGKTSAATRASDHDGAHDQKQPIASEAIARNFATLFVLFATFLPKSGSESLDTWCTVKREDGLAAVFESVTYLSRG
jgi:hypothetical protein